MADTLQLDYQINLLFLLAFLDFKNWKIKNLPLTLKNYLGCRMDKGLMTKESWDKLGFSDLDSKKES